MTRRTLPAPLVALAVLLAAGCSEAGPPDPSPDAPTPAPAANPWGPDVRQARPHLDHADAVLEGGCPDRDVVVSMEVVPRLPGARGPVALKFRFQLTWADGKWQPAPKGFQANVYNYHWPTPPRFSNIRIDGQAIPDDLAWTPDNGLNGTLRWRFEKPFRDLLAPGVDKHVPDSAWPFIPQQGEIRVDLPLNPNAKHPRPTGLPPWWLPTVFGFNYYGSFTYAAAGQTFTGEAELNIAPRPVPGKFVPWTAVWVTKAPHAVHFRATLPTRRVAAEASGFAKYAFPEPLDASDFDGLRLTVTTDAPRRDAWVAVGLKEGDGAWYYSPAACPLTQECNTWILPFDRLTSAGFVIGRGAFDPNMAFDSRAIRALAVGAHNPFGVGDVRFNLERVELVRWADSPYAAPPDQTAVVSVDAATAVRRNGVHTVPEELMGVHLVGGFDPADFPEGYFRRLNIRHARPLQHTSFTPTKKVSVPDAAALRHLGLVDAALVCYTWGNLWGRAPWMDHADILPGVRQWGDQLGRDAWTPGDDANPLRRVEFWNEPFMWGRHINAYDPDLVDPTQHGYIPARLGAEKYAQCFVAAVDAAKAENPHVQIGGMSSPSFNGDHYSVFWDYIRHFIDACPDKIDFLSEHHYGGNPAAYAAAYEVVTAYCDTRHGRRIPIVNTETNDLVDTPTFGDEGLPAPWSPHADDLIRFRYNVRDIITLIDQCPDKARARAMHALWNGKFKKKGEEHAFEILNDVAGAILDCRSSHADVPAVACTSDDRVVVLVLNDAPQPRNVRLDLKGLSPAAVAVRRVVFDTAAGTQVVAADGPPPGEVLRLAPYEAVSWSLHAPGHKVRHTRVLTEHFADVHLRAVEPGEAFDAPVIWRDPPARPKAAFLRVVTEGVEPGEAFVDVATGQTACTGGPGPNLHRFVTHRVDLPASTGLVQDLPLPLPIAPQDLKLRFRCADHRGTEDGYRVLMAAVYLEE